MEHDDGEHRADENPVDNGRKATMRELICTYVVGKAKPLVFGQLLAFWLVRAFRYLGHSLFFDKNNRILSSSTQTCTPCAPSSTLLGINWCHTVKIAPGLQFIRTNVFITIVLLSFERDLPRNIDTRGEES